jgi:hypothetical protein
MEFFHAENERRGSCWKTLMKFTGLADPDLTSNVSSRLVLVNLFFFASQQVSRRTNQSHTIGHVEVNEHTTSVGTLMNVYRSLSLSQTNHSTEKRNETQVTQTPKPNSLPNMSPLLQEDDKPEHDRMGDEVEIEGRGGSDWEDYVQQRDVTAISLPSIWSRQRRELSNDHDLHFQHDRSMLLGMSTTSMSKPTSYKWKLLEDDDIPVIPEMYPKVSYPLIPPRDMSLSRLTKKIEQALVLHEIKYCRDSDDDNDNEDWSPQSSAAAVARLNCRTPCVDFRIQLWKRPRRDSRVAQKRNIKQLQRRKQNQMTMTNNSNPNIAKQYDDVDGEIDVEWETIIEIQRQKGCCIAMHRVRSRLAKFLLMK